MFCIDFVLSLYDIWDASTCGSDSLWYFSIVLLVCGLYGEALDHSQWQGYDWCRHHRTWWYKPVASCQGQFPPPSLNFGLSENFLFVGKFMYKNAQFVLKYPHFCGNLGTKLKFWAPIISSIRNLQQSVGKLQLTAPPHFFHPRRGWYKLIITECWWMIKLLVVVTVGFVFVSSVRWPDKETSDCSEWQSKDCGRHSRTWWEEERSIEESTQPSEQGTSWLQQRDGELNLW